MSNLCESNLCEFDCAVQVYCLGIILGQLLAHAYVTIIILFRFMRAVAYRWLIRWICGYLGWDNSRPLSACIYDHIRRKFPVRAITGFMASEERN
eukprot:Seg1677.5 transcript_id=Seg1677.5/GoldUCD/mRNA.D3Y31 product="hypothetical protein" protein_id=Seg1677.5/GoldUCD/D3Y31